MATWLHSSAHRTLTICSLVPRYVVAKVVWLERRRATAEDPCLHTFYSSSILDDDLTPRLFPWSTSFFFPKASEFFIYMYCLEKFLYFFFCKSSSWYKSHLSKPCHWKWCTFPLKYSRYCQKTTERSFRFLSWAPQSWSPRAKSSFFSSYFIFFHQFSHKEKENEKRDWIALYICCSNSVNNVIDKVASSLQS